ncbi:CvpA family protein [Candidatus Microgenomates bacterium]|nr:CvpA family protein [Candidatus Microgenomates bacterium]
MNFPNLNGNYVDLIILFVFIYFATEAFRHGFWVIMADFMAFLSSLILALRFFKPVSIILKNNFNLTYSISDAIGFLISAILIESLLAFLLGHLIHKLPTKLKKHKFNKLLGVVPAFGEGIILVSFFLTLAIALPIKPVIKNDVTNSKIGSFLLEKTVGVENVVNSIFGGVINDSLTYLTIHPESGESIDLEVDSFNLQKDEQAEKKLFEKVNSERKKLAIEELSWNPEVVQVARDHGSDMWNRKYFSHFSLQGDSVSDRLKEGGVDYVLAGENLALAPTTMTAHTGLMNSEGHRQNILDPNFKKLGIGVIDNGVYGKMFVQIFIR